MLGRILTISAVLLLALGGCQDSQDRNPTSVVLGDEAGMRLSLVVPTDLNIDSGEVTVTKGDLVYSRTVDLEDGSATVLFTELQPGIWQIMVELYDEDGFLLYEGSGEAEIQGGETTSAHILLTELSGGLEIEITLPGFTAPEVAWSQAILGAGNEYGTGVVQIPDGGYAVTGGTGRWPDGDTFLLKLQGNGDLAWQQQYGRPFHDQGVTLQNAPDGEIIVGGYATSANGTEDFSLLRTDAAGTLVWATLIGNPDCTECLFDFAVTPDDGFIITGFSGPWNARDVCLLKATATGAVEWGSTFGGLGWDTGCGVLQTPDGGYLVCGRADTDETGYRDAYVIRTDADGNEIWSQVFGGDNDDEVFGSAIAADGSFVMVGYTRSYGAGDQDGWMFKVDDAGNCLWEQTYGGTEDGSFQSIARAGASGWIVAGWSGPHEDAGLEGWFVKTTAHGEQRWEVRTGGADQDVLWSVIQDEEGGFVATGWTRSHGTESEDIWVVRLDPEDR